MDSRKAVFLPIDDRILTLYKGYVDEDGQMVKYITNHWMHEDVPSFLKHCKVNNASVYVYSYDTINTTNSKKLDKLVEKGLIRSYLKIEKLADLNALVKRDNISLENSFMVIKEFEEAEEAAKLGLDIDYDLVRNVELWKERVFPDKGGRGSLEWNSKNTLASMEDNIEYYLKAKDNLFLTREYILFVEDSYDEKLNAYLLGNIDRINSLLAAKGMYLIYFPALKNGDIQFQSSLLNFVRYRVPVLYSLSDDELQESLNILLNNLSPEQFYRMVLQELDIPYFKRPALLRNILQRYNSTACKFTYTTIQNNTEEYLDKIFDWYINHVTLYPDGGRFFFSVDPEKDYDADAAFESEIRKDTEEIMSKINLLQKQGKHGVLAEALIYILESLNNIENTEVVRMIRLQIEKKKLLESKTRVSPIFVDKNYRILLPDFGNKEVKMHSLPKAVYLLFLRYPEGIRFKELYQYKKELLEIYNKITKKYDDKEVIRAIEDLVDMTNPSINQKCARIREAFRAIMDEHIAKQYYIDGENGQPKKIALAHTLIYEQN